MAPSTEISLRWPSNLFRWGHTVTVGALAFRSVEGLESIEFRNERNEQSPMLAFNSGRFVLCGLSIRRRPAGRAHCSSRERISEVIGLTAVDWAVSRFLNQLSASNKGSLGIRTKRLVISHGLAKLYRRYFDDAEHARLAWDPHHHSMNDLQRIVSEDPNRLSSIPLFLTERGTPMLFRDYYWRPALQASGIHAHPHQARHWFVTNALRISKQAPLVNRTRGAVRKCVKPVSIPPTRNCRATVRGPR